MSDMIRVVPAPQLLKCFAGWATAQTPKIGTVEFNAFAVPAHLFHHAPEELLIGALVDGHPYVSPDDGDELTGVLEFREAVPGEPLPEVDASAYGPDSTPLDFAPLEDADDGDSDPSDPSDSAAEDEEDGFPCSGCDRTFTTERGRDTHRRMAHTEES